MSIIAFDGKTLAADRRGVRYGMIMTMTKIRRCGALRAGSVGNVSSLAELLRWVECGRKPEAWPTRQGDDDKYGDLMVIEGGRIFIYEQSPYPTEIEQAFFAIGSGREYAMAAMACGKSAVEAVEIACQFDTGCGNGIDILGPEL